MSRPKPNAKGDAEEAARSILDNFSDAAAIDTGNADECGFIIAAARLALTDPELAARIAEEMQAASAAAD